MMSDFARQFHTPPREFAPVPFWFWNGDLREEELLRQLRELKAKGCGGFILEPRHGLRVPFLSERWFQLVRRVVDEAARLGLLVWLYDEESWPSGTAGGRITCEHPDLRGRYLKSYELDRDTGFKVPEGEELVYAVVLPTPTVGVHWNLAQAVELTSDLLSLHSKPSAYHRLFVFTEVAYGHVDPMNPAVAQEFLTRIHEVYATACGEHFGSTVVGIFTDEPTLVSPWEARERWLLPWSPLLPEEFKNEHGYDLIPFLPSLILDTGVSASKVRQDFWQTVRRLYVSNFFEPIAQWCAEHRLALTGHLLYEEPLFRQARFQGDALSVYRQMHVPGVDNAGVEIGGLHHKLCVSVAHHSPLPPCGRGVGGEGKRVLSHTFGGCGWGVSLAERKAALDWQLAMGVNLFAPHAIYYSIHGKRKRESPPSEFHEPHWRYYQYFSDYVMRLCWALSQGQHVAKVCVLYPLWSAWAQPVDVTADDVEKDLFYVCDQLTRLHYDYDFIDEETLVVAKMQDGRLMVGEESYEMLVLPSITVLSRAAWEKIKAFYQNGGKVAALGLLPRESEHGLDEDMEKEIAATAWVDMNDLYAAFSRAAHEGGVAELYPVFREDHSGGRFCSYQPRLCEDQEDAKLRVRQILRESVMPDVDTGNEWIVYHHRIMGTGDRGQGTGEIEAEHSLSLAPCPLPLHFYFFVNTSAEEQRVSLRLDATGAPEWWDAETGNVTLLHVYSVIEDEDEKTMVLPLQFAPHESKLIVIRPEERLHIDTTNIDVESVHLPSRDGEGAVIIEGYVDEETTPFAEMTWNGEPLWLQGERTPPLPPLELDDGWMVEREDDNVLVLPDWQFRRGHHAPSRLERLKSLLRGKEWEMLPLRERITPRPRLEPLERELPPTVTYRTTFDVVQVPPSLFLVMEPIDAPCEVYVNRQRVTLTSEGMERWKDKGGLPYADAQNVCADVTRFVNVGENIITLIADYRHAVAPPPDHLHRITCDLVPERAWIVGSFSVVRSLGSWMVTLAIQPSNHRATQPPNHLTTQPSNEGYPYYSGTMIYRRTFSLPTEYVGKKLTLEFVGNGLRAVPNVLKLEVNGQTAGVWLWSPFRFDVSHLLREGENVLTLHVTNAAAHALLGEEQLSGLLGSVRLVAQHRIVLRGGEETS